MLLIQCNLTGAICRLLLVSKEFCSPGTHVVVTMSSSGNTVVGSAAETSSCANHEHIYMHIHMTGNVVDT